MNILNGAIFNSGGAIWVQETSLTNALVLVSGAQLNFTGATSYLNIGVGLSLAQSASVVVQNGGSINLASAVTGFSGINLFIGSNDSGSLTITGAGSSVSTPTDVTIGRDYMNQLPGTTGILSLLNGGTLTIDSTKSISLGGSKDEGFTSGIGIINFGSTAGKTGAAGLSGTLAFSGNIYLEGGTGAPAASQINFNNTDTATLGASILMDTTNAPGSTLALSMVGTGTAILTGNSNYVGTTTVGGGTVAGGTLADRQRRYDRNDCDQRVGSQPLDIRLR